MAVTSIPFAFFTILTVIAYYAFPKRNYSWIVLLIASSFFYAYNSFRYCAFILLTILSIYTASRVIDSIGANARAFLKSKKDVWTREERKAYKAKTEKKRRLVLAAALLLNFGILFILKYFNFFSGSVAAMLGADVSGAPRIDILLPLGISFYTFTSTGYLIDVYRGTVEPEKNIFRFALFVSFFPHIVQGPISSFESLHHQLIERHAPCWTNLKHGVMQIAWGLFKKLVIADAAWVAIKAYYDNGGMKGNDEFAGYGGSIVLFIVLLYSLQLYADFSGGIDISRGICRLLGIELEVNFRQPYFSRSISEYWRRWHITLGEWMKKYVFYPVAMSQLSVRVSKWIAGTAFGKTAAGRHISKVFMTAVASFVVFLLVGIWHGANSKYIGFGVWNGAIIMLSALLGPVYAGSRTALHIKDSSFLWRLFQMFRTFVIVAIGYIFDISDNFSNAIDMMKSIAFNRNRALFFEQLPTLGLNNIDYYLIAGCTLIVLYMSIRLEMTSTDSPGELLEKRNGLLQWAWLVIIIVITLVFGMYGPSYDAAEFVYMQF